MIAAPASGPAASPPVGEDPAEPPTSLRSVSGGGALWWLWATELASRVGEAFFQITLLWYLVESVGSHLEVGLITMVGYLPALAVGAWAGVWVDRFPPRSVMLLSTLLRAGIVLSIPLWVWLGHLSPLGVGVLAFGVATCTAFFNPARDAAIPRYAQGEHLLRANSLVQSAWQFSLLIGPVLAAVALGWLPTVSLFIGVAAAFLLSALILLRLPPAPALVAAVERQQPGASQEVQAASIGGDFRDGLRYLYTDRRIFWIWVITGANNFFLMGPVIVGMPIYVRAHLSGSGTDFAMIEGAYAGGMIVATWAIARWARRWVPERMLFWGLIYDGLTYVPLLWVTSVPQTLLVVVIHSLGIPMITIGRLTALHRMVRPAFRGRVFSYVNLAVSGMTALSIGSVGIALNWISSAQLFPIIGMACALCGVFGLLLPHFRHPQAASPAVPV